MERQREREKERMTEIYYMYIHKNDIFFQL